MSFHPQMPYGEGFHKSERKFAEEGPAFEFTPEHRARLDEICTHYPPERRKSAVLAALYLAQAQQGWISGRVIRHVAEVIGCTTAEVEDVVTYYVMFFSKPVGKHVIQVCRTLSCALLGAERVTEALAKKLGCGVGETDATGEFTLMEFECLGACDRAPVVMVDNEHWHERLRPEDCDTFIDELRAKGLAALSGCHLARE